MIWVLHPALPFLQIQNKNNDNIVLLAPPRPWRRWRRVRIRESEDSSFQYFVLNVFIETSSKQTKVNHNFVTRQIVTVEDSINSAFKLGCKAQILCGCLRPHSIPSRAVGVLTSSCLKVLHINCSGTSCTLQSNHLFITSVGLNYHLPLDGLSLLVTIECS